MATLLYLVHRMPYPPDKGDKVRSYHLLKHLLAQGHEVHLGTFIDDPDDARHVPALQALCASVCAVTLNPRTAKLASLAGLATGEALTLRYYRSTAMQRWVAQTVAAHRIDAAVVFSSSMAPYAMANPKLPMVLDLVDVDSAKWTDYAPNHPWPLSWLYRREGRRLLDFERQAVHAAVAAFLVTSHEVALLEQLAPDIAGQVQALGNGVDTGYFSPAPAQVSPFGADELALVFTGAMDYWPNVDAVGWFVRDMLPALRQLWPALRFYIVGRNPTPAVLALAGEAVTVTGTVPDVRPYLQHAAVVVAPLRLARGVQNKVLEAMAMARPVVIARACAQAIDAEVGRHLLDAERPDQFVSAIDGLLAAPTTAQALGLAARDQVLQRYNWSARLAPLAQSLPRRGAVSSQSPAHGSTSGSSA